jgi:long-chain fatty acid transport protein
MVGTRTTTIRLLDIFVRRAKAFSVPALRFWLLFSSIFRFTGIPIKIFQERLMKQGLRVSLLSAAGLIALTTVANAAGFYIQEQSVRGLGSAFSGSATTLNDASTIYFNPAGMTKLEGLQAQAGVHLIIPDADLKNNGTTSSGPFADGGNPGNPYDPTPVPNGFVSYQVTDQIWAGIGVTAPFGLASDYGDDWFGRFDSTKTELTVIDIQPTLAYKINDMISVGAGVNIAHSDADLRSRAVIPGPAEVNSQLEGDDWGYGYSLGLQIKPIETTTIGVNYKSAVHHNLDGKIELTNDAGTVLGPGTFSTPGTAKLSTPDHATFGISHELNNQWTIMGQATWFGWSNFDSITAIRDSGAVASNVQQNYQNTWAFALGAEYEANEDWTFRGGVQFDETPTTDEFRTSRTPDGDRTWVSLGATYALTDAIDLDLAATYIDVAEGDINVARGVTGGRTIATTDGRVGILATGISYKF